MSEIRKAKYCPQCGTMALLESPACATCGHQFQTGLPTPEEMVRPEDDDEFNKTQLFMMSPVMVHRPEEPVTPLPVGDALPAAGRIIPRKWIALAVGVAVLLGLCIWGANAFFAPREAHPATIVGRWARATSRGTVGLMFAKDGSGALFWQPVQGTEGGGSVVLHWNQTPEGLLRLSSAPPVVGGPEVQQSVALLASRPWVWDVDKERLTLGRLTFMRQ